MPVARAPGYTEANRDGLSPLRRRLIYIKRTSEGFDYRFVATSCDNHAAANLLAKEHNMRRIYFLVPDIPAAKRIVDELLLARIEERHLHVIAKRGTPLEDLPEASLLQKTDFIPAVERGVALGGTAGLLAGLVAIAIPPAMTVVAGGILLASALAGAGVGAWLGGMAGMNVGNTRLKRFEDAIEAGQLLVLADVPRVRVEEIEERVRQHLPKVEIEGTEPTIPAFP